MFSGLVNNSRLLIQSQEKIRSKHKLFKELLFFINSLIHFYRPNPNEELPAFAKALLPPNPPPNPGNPDPPPKLELPAFANEFDDPKDGPPNPYPPG